MPTPALDEVSRKTPARAPSVGNAPQAWRCEPLLIGSEALYLFTGAAAESEPSVRSGQDAAGSNGHL